MYNIAISPICFKKFNNPEKIKKLNNDEILDGEIFKDITSNIVPLVYDYYQISNFGRVYHKYLGIIMSPGLNGAGYQYVMLSTYNIPVPVQIHRLVMLSFFYIPGCENLDVNHKDGNKLNNKWWNLEWTTRSENVIHAYNTGLQKKGENNIHTKLTNKTVEKVCELLQENKYTNKQISNIVGNNLTPEIVASIKKRDSWKDISKDYIFFQRKGRKFDNETVENLCIYFQNNFIENLTINEHCKHALDFYGYDSSPEVIDCARKIYTRKYYTNISNKYNF